MSIIAFIGTHGTGKSTIADMFVKEYPSFYHYKDIMKIVTLRSGYNSVKESIKDNGIDVFISSIINSMYSLEHHRKVIIEHAPIGYMAYYYAHLDKWGGKPNLFIERLAEHYTKMIDYYIYFPIKIPLICDGWRGNSPEYQNKIDKMLKSSIRLLEIPSSAIYEVKSVGIEERYKEVKGKISLLSE